jgi:peptidoglycan/LPS O-acetylase OafA/YrhL
MPELDTIRGIAILAVIIFHGFEDIASASTVRPFWQVSLLNAINQGWTGVNLFFVLSGFLITGILLETRNAPDYYSRFYSHRILRILPAYYMLLLVLFVLGLTRVLPGTDLYKFLGLSCIYLSNLATLFGVTVYYWPLWSLAVEEHFYLIWPAVVRRLSRRGLALGAVAICLVEPLLRIHAMKAGVNLWWAGPNRLGSFRYTWMSADGLALGALLAIFARSPWGTRKNFATLALSTAAGTIVLFTSTLAMPVEWALCLKATLVNYGAMAIIAGFLWLGTGAHRGWANIRVLSFYGFISYGLYLIHYLTIMFYTASTRTFAPVLRVGTDFGLAWTRFAICLLAATITAYVSRITFEEYFLQMKKKAVAQRATSRRKRFDLNSNG